MKRLISILLVLCVVFSTFSVVAFAEQNEVTQKTESMYLSNMTPVYSKVGWGELEKDINSDKKTLSLIVNGTRKYFYKGVAAHAAGEIIYDLGDGTTYDKLDTYMGVDASKSGGGSVKFYVYTSNDGENWQNTQWETRYTSDVRTSKNEAIHLNISITGAKYLRFVFDPDGANGQDHAILCDAVIYSGDILALSEEQISNVGYFDKMFQNLTYEQIYDTHKIDLLRRALVEKAGYETLCYSFFTGENEQARRDMMEWLWNDEDALTDLITGGDPNSGTIVDALNILTKLYSNYKDDLNDTQDLFEPETGSTRNRGDVYRTMMISIALTHTRGPYSWLNSSIASDPIERYAAFKKTYLADIYHLRRDYFENLCVEEMRYVMSNRIWNDEIYWLNAYLRIKGAGKTYPAVYSPHAYMRYGKDWDYSAKGFLNNANFATYDAKYRLTEFDSTAPSGRTKLWMVLEGSHICWGISYTGSNFAGAFGVPSHYVRQEDHAAFFVYSKDSNNRTMWSIDNNIYGWTVTWLAEDVVGNGNNRMMCNWGTRGNGWSSGLNATYINLASTALDDQQNYEKAEMYLTLLSLARARGQEEELYREALKAQSYHLDAWYGLVNFYKANKTAKQKAELTSELTEAMKFFPLPMLDLTNIIKNSMTATDVETKSQLAQVVSYQQRALVIASGANTNSEAKILLTQPSICATEASYLLGKTSGSVRKLASFSFDGANAGCLVFDSTYAGSRYRYSLDGGITWSAVGVTESDNLKHKFTDAEIASITATNDIHIWLEGWSTETGEPVAEDAFLIDILDGQTISGIESNDNENRILGNVSCMEYTIDGTNWYELTNATKFEGAKTITVRKRPNGVTLVSPTTTFTFTDNNTAKRSYITIDRLQVTGFSTEEASQNNYAKYVIDGLYNTVWHTRWKGGDNDRYVIVKADKPTYFSGVTYTSTGGNGCVSACSVYVSLDSVNWCKAGSATGWPGWYQYTRELTFAPVYGQYIKFVADSGAGGFASARSIDFFEDTTLAGKTVNGIKIKNNPTKTEYFVGEKLNISGLVAVLVFDDNTTATIPATELVISQDVFYTTGKQTAYVVYGDLAPAPFTVNIKERNFTPTTITIQKTPDKTTYYQGDTIVSDGIKVLVSNGTTSTYLTDNEFTVTVDLTTAGTQKATVTYGELTAQFDITVKKAIESISVDTKPNKSSYTLGETFDPTGIAVSVKYKDGTTEQLTDTSNYIFVDTDTFSYTSGNKNITVAVSDAQNIFTTFEVLVHPYFTLNGVNYELNTADNGTMTCSVKGVEPNNSFVNIPSQVKFGNVSYPVVSIEANAFGSACSCSAVALPATITKIEQGAFSDCDSLQKIYLTEHKTFANLNAEEGAFGENVEFVLLAANEELTQELSEKDFVKNTSMTVNDVTTEITGISIVTPNKTSYFKGEDLDITGLVVKATLSDNNSVVINDNAYTVSNVDLTTSGEKTVTITLKANENYSQSFNISVADTVLKITEHPQSAVYYRATDIILPLNVEIVTNGTNVKYQWYKATNGVINHDTDAIEGATTKQYTPDVSGTYYVGVTVDDKTVYSMVAEFEKGDYTVIIGTKGYNSIAEAIAAAPYASTIYLLKDTTINAEISFNKHIDLKGNGYTISRANGFTGAFFSVNSSGAMALDNVILDGGAIWTGEVNSILGRGTVNSGINAQSPLIRVVDTARVSLYNTVTLRNNCNTNSDTSIYSSKGTTAGAIFAKNSATVVVSGATIENCFSYIFGGAIYVRDTASLTINQGTIHGNSGSTQWNTSAICIDNTASCTVNGGTFCHNLGQAKGGVFWLGNGKFTVNDATFENNYSTNGSGIYVHGTANVSLNNYESMQEIFLASGRKLNITGDLTGKSLPIKTESTADNVVVATSSNKDLLETVLAGLSVNGKSVTLVNGEIKTATQSNFVAKITRNGVEYNYTSFDIALSEAKENDEIVLLKDITISAEKQIAKTITITYGSFSITGKEFVVVADDYFCNDNGSSLIISMIPELKLSGASLTLQSNLKMNWMVDKSILTNGYSNPYIKINFCGVETIIKNYIVEDKYLKFEFKNISPDKINDTVNATVYANFNGVEYASEIKEYSITTYCRNILNTYTDAKYQNLRVLLVDLLNYGSATQVFNNYKTDNLASSILTDEEKNLASNDTDYKTVTEANYETIQNKTVNWKGAMLRLNNVIAMKFVIETNNKTGIYVIVKDSKGKSFKITNNNFTNYAQNQYSFEFNSFDVSQLEESVYVTVYNANGEAISNTLRYSIESYAYAKQNSTDTNLQQLVKSMMRYGRSAKVFKG